MIKQRNAANTALNDAGWHISNYDKSVYLNPANKNPERFERSKQTYADAEKNTEAYNAAIQRELKKEEENLRGIVTSTREQLDREIDEYKKAQAQKPFCL